MTAPTTLDITYHPGRVTKLDLTVVDSANDPVDLTGLSGSDINYIMQESRYSSAHQIYKEISSGITVTDATNGVIQVVIGTSDGSEITFVDKDLSFYHRLEVTVNSEPDISMEGTVTVRKAGNRVVNIEIGGDTTGRSPVAAASYELAWELPAGTLTLS